MASDMSKLSGPSYSGHIAMDSGANQADLIDFKNSDLPSAVPRTAASTAVLAEQALLSDLDSEIEQSEENQRWSIGGVGGASLVILGGAGELIRALKRPERTGLERWWSDDVAG
jgi:hypothetical protein